MSVELNDELNVLKERIDGAAHPKQVVLLLTAFLGKLTRGGNTDLVYPFFAEFIEEYIAALELYTPEYSHPSLTENLLETLKPASASDLFRIYGERTEAVINDIGSKLEQLIFVLNGGVVSATTKQHAVFPILTTGDCETELLSPGFTDSLSIRIEKTKLNDKLIWLPAGETAQNEIAENALNLAYGILYPGEKRKDYYSVWIIFNEQHGNYIGTSFGISLTLAMLEALAVFNNNTHFFKLSNGLAFTGSISSDGVIAPLPTGIAGKKAAICFFSDLHSLVVPRENEQEARDAVDVLRKEFPLRKFKIIGADSIKDLLDRRTLIDIRKQPFALRVVRAVIMHKIQAALFVLVMSAVTLLLFADFDNNPAQLAFQPDFFSVKNKYGKILWIKKALEGSNYNEDIVRIIDIDNDGKNEILITDDYVHGTDSIKENGRTACYSSDGVLLWKHTFSASLETDVEKIPDSYKGGRIVDTIRVEGELRIVIFSNSNYSFPGCLYQITAKTGKETGKRLYHPGHFIKGVITEIYGKDKPTLLFTAINNSEECLAVGKIAFKDIGGFIPAITRPQYHLKNTNAVLPEKYLLIPKSDYTVYFKQRTNTTRGLKLKELNGEIFVCLTIVEPGSLGGAAYNFTKNFDSVFTVIGSDFRVARDTLVAKGKLPLPYTDTPEYQEILIDSLKRWNGKGFVKLMR